MKKYIILYSQSSLKLQEHVEEAMKNGYEVYGYIVKGNTGFVREMVYVGKPSFKERKKQSIWRL